MDIMYFGYPWDKDGPKFQEEFIKDVKEKFPNVKLENAYDGIKGYRQSVHLPDTETDNYMCFLIGKGWLELSLTLQIAMMDKSEHDKVKGWFAMAKKEYPEAFKPETVKDDEV